MKLRYLALLALGAFADAFAGPVRPVLDTTLKGANGNEAKFTIVAVWTDGFHIRQPAGKAPLFITWDKVDVTWLETERPDLHKLKTAAKPFPALTPEQAKEKLEAAKKNFRASKTITYTAPSSKVMGEETRTVKNDMAEKYAARVRSLTPENLTQALGQIVADVESDVEKLKDTNSRLQQIQRGWLTGSFMAYLGQLEKVQREIDPAAAGDVVMPKVASGFRAAKTDDEWF